MYSVKWRDYNSSLETIFRQLYSDHQFADVTLFCEGANIPCHKVVLSACSPYFREVFLKNPCSHPVIVLHGIKLWQITGLLEYMYNGSLCIEQEKMASLIDVAVELNIETFQDHVVEVSSSQDGKNKISCTVPATVVTTREEQETPKRIWQQSTEQKSKRTKMNSESQKKIVPVPAVQEKNEYDTEEDVNLQVIKMDPDENICLEESTEEASSSNSPEQSDNTHMILMKSESLSGVGIRVRTDIMDEHERHPNEALDFLGAVLSPRTNLSAVAEVLSNLDIKTLTELSSLNPEVHLSNIVAPIEAWSLKRTITKKLSILQSGNSTCGSTSVTDRDESFKDWLQNYQIPWHLLPQSFSMACQQGTRGLMSDRKKLVRLIGIDIRSLGVFPSKVLLEQVAQKVVGLYPQTLSDRVGRAILGNGYDFFLRQLVAEFAKYQSSTL